MTDKTTQLTSDDASDADADPDALEKLDEGTSEAEPEELDEAIEEEARKLVEEIEAGEIDPAASAQSHGASEGDQEDEQTYGRAEAYADEKLTSGTSKTPGSEQSSGTDTDEGDDGLWPIPEEWQELTLEEVLEQDYDVVPEEFVDDDDHVDERPPPVVMDASWGGPQPGEGALSEEEIFQDQHAYDFGRESAASTDVGLPKERDDHADRLQKFNEGNHQMDGRLSERQAQWDKQRITHALCNQLGLTDHQRDGALRYMMAMNLDRFGSQKEIARVGLVAIRFVVERERMQRDGEEMTRMSEEEQYRVLLEDVGMDMGDVMSISKTFKEQLKEFEPAGQFYTGLGPGRDANLPATDPRDRPDEYWDEIPDETWEHLAEQWEKVPDDTRDAIPEECREQVLALRDEIAEEASDE